MVVFSDLLRKARAAFRPRTLPYPLFAYTGVLLWQFFARSLSEASTSLAANERLLTKVYFPRIYVPLSVILAAVVDLGIASILAIPLLAYYGCRPTLLLLMTPLVVFMVVLVAFGVGLLFSALDVRYRDLRYVAAVPEPALDVCIARRLPGGAGSGALANSLRAESDGRHHRDASAPRCLGDQRRFRGRCSVLVAWPPLGLSLLGLFVFQKTERRLTDIV